MSLLPFAIVLLSAVGADGRPQAPGAFCGGAAYAALCQNGGQPECSLCHTTPPQFNPFGSDVSLALWALPDYSGAEFIALLPDALADVQALDSDGDGASNFDELVAGRAPGQPDSIEPMPDDLEWDAELAFKRVNVLFCGRSASFDDRQALAASSTPKVLVHERLDACLASDYWRNEALHRIADPLISPLDAIDKDGVVSLANSAWDYRLFSHAMSDGRDARDLLLADYHVLEDGTTRAERIDREQLPEFPGVLGGDRISLGTGQPLAPDRRCGMITTQWFLVRNTMFAAVPRTSAAQAYRAYLGLDIALGQGLYPVDGEPRDVDGLNVAQPACAVCHSTLDPLSYAFSTYNGIELGTDEDGDVSVIDAINLIFSNPFGAYNEDRAPWEADGYIFGEPVIDLRQWCSVAANSDAFARNIAEMLFQYVFRRAPSVSDREMIEMLSASLPGDGYSVNALLHRLIDTTAFGGR